MSFLIIEGSVTVRKSLCYVLLTLGIRGIPVSSVDEALQYIKKNEDIDVAIVDIDNDEVGGIGFIEQIRKIKDDIQIIVHTIQSNKEIVLQMIDLGVVGYLLKPYVEKDAGIKIKKILEKIEGHTKQRKHIRIKPDPNELLRVHFRISGYPHLISGKIIDLSMGGMAIELITPVEENVLKTGIYIPRLQFALSSKQLSPAAIIIAIKAKILALRFESINPQDNIVLAKYIFKQISL